MNRKSLLLLTLLVAVPLGLLTWAGWRIARDERAVLQQRVRDLLTDRLGDIDRSIADHIAALQRDLQQLTTLDTFETDRLRELVREEPRVLQLFVIHPDGSLLHPDPSGPLNRTEEEFLVRASPIVVDRELQRAAVSSHEESQPPEPDSPKSDPTGSSSSPGRTSGWFVWYWGRGLNLVYWQRRPSGHIVGAALDRSRWIADLIAALPDTSDAAGDAPGTLSRIRLIDSKSQPVYQWGPFDPPADAAATCEIALSPPLSAWRLQQFVPVQRLMSGAGTSAWFSLGTALTAAAIGLLVLAVYFVREYARDMREAGRRVSFVNQVSHELRTPLTNIRMYADLLEADFDRLPEESAAQPRARLGVIRSESQRLSRLIGNVLTFARQQRRTLRLNPAPACVDRIIDDVLERFRPSLQEEGIQTHFDAQAPGDVLVDADALEQILGNLISNVEKYAAQGRWLGVSTRQENGRTTLTLTDRGPGIEARQREQIFCPFWRGSDSLHHASGTGIGLSIARDLARLHGGDVRLLDTDEGACFEVRLSTPPADQDDKA